MLIEIDPVRLVSLLKLEIHSLQFAQQATGLSSGWLPTASELDARMAQLNELENLAIECAKPLARGYQELTPAQFQERLARHHRLEQLESDMHKSFAKLLSAPCSEKDNQLLL